MNRSRSIERSNDPFVDLSTTDDGSERRDEDVDDDK
jgi:hypothetical protein